MMSIISADDLDKLQQAQELETARAELALAQRDKAIEALQRVYNAWQNNYGMAPAMNMAHRVLAEIKDGK